MSPRARYLAGVFVVAMLAMAAADCAPLAASAGLSVGRDPAGQLVADQRLIDIFGAEGAVQQLVLIGVPERAARKRVLAAQIARGDRGKE
jgi:hypothetical protein